MADFGMQMPGGQNRKAASANVYTGLMFAAVVALAIAVGLVWQAASAVGPRGNAFGLQDESSIELPDNS